MARCSGEEEGQQTLQEGVEEEGDRQLLEGEEAHQSEELELVEQQGWLQEGVDHLERAI